MSEQALAPVIPLPVLPAPDWAAIERWERKIAHERAQFPPRLRVVR